MYGKLRILSEKDDLGSTLLKVWLCPEEVLLVDGPLKGKSAVHLCGFGEDIPQRNTTIPTELGKYD